MDGERFSHSGHDDGSTADGGNTAGYRPPFQATARSLGGAMHASMYLATHHRVGGSTTANQARWQASCYHGPAARVAMA
jgi:hypothetical protein